MSTVVIIALIGFILVLTLGQPTGRHRLNGPRVVPLRPAKQRLHLAEGTVDDNPLENGSRWILVRHGSQVRVVST